MQELLGGTGGHADAGTAVARALSADTLQGDNWTKAALEMGHIGEPDSGLVQTSLELEVAVPERHWQEGTSLTWERKLGDERQEG